LNKILKSDFCGAYSTCLKGTIESDIFNQTHLTYLLIFPSFPPAMQHLLPLYHHPTGNSPQTYFSP